MRVNSMPEPGEFTTLSERVYTAIRGEIASGKLAPGTRLVRRNLAKQLHVSPVPVTEALFRLESDGLVESAPMYGARVVAMTEADVLDDLVMREALECQAARECALGASDESIQKLAQLARAVDRVMRAGADPMNREYDELHGEFHLSIARLGGRERLARELQRVWYRRHMHRAWVNATQQGLPSNWHEKLVEAIGTREESVAERAMRFHVRWKTARHQAKVEK